MTRDELLDLLARLRRASVGGIRAPHKPVLLLWLFGRFVAVGSTVATYEEAEEPGQHADQRPRPARRECIGRAAARSYAVRPPGA